MKHVVVVTFPNLLKEGWRPHNKEYNFLCEYEGLKEGDELIAKTQHGVQRVRFIRYDDESYIKETGKKRANQWIVGKL